MVDNNIKLCFIKIKSGGAYAEENVSGMDLSLLLFFVCVPNYIKNSLTKTTCTNVYFINSKLKVNKNTYKPTHNDLSIHNAYLSKCTILIVDLCIHIALVYWNGNK